MAGCSKSAQNDHEGGVILEAEETCDALLACLAEQVPEEIP